MSTTTQTKSMQPDISYHPDYEKYQLRSEKVRSQLKNDTKLPSNFPRKLAGPLVWEGKDFTNESEWTLSLREPQLAEIHEALKHFQSLHKSIGYVSQITFPLPELRTILREEAKNLQSGRGFFVIRGLPFDKYSIEKKHLTQTAVSENIGAPAYTRDKQVFHTDAGDIVSLFSLNVTAQGGESKLASSWRVYNELAKTRPDIIKTLSEDWTFDGYGNSDQPYTNRPLLFHTPATDNAPERVVIQYSRRGFTGFLHLPRTEGIPPITEAQAEALDALHFLAERFSLTLDFQKGDIQFVNNLSIFHARDEFVDTLGKERHLLRLWLRDPELAWNTPEPLRARWDSLYKDVTEDEQVFPLEPKIRGGSGKA